jgi:CubicO group peptidase (beta-lactamase class C family)
MKKHWLQFVAVFVFSAATVFSQNSVSLTPEKAIQLQNAVNRETVKDVSVAVMFPNDSIWYGFKGHANNSTLIDNKTLFSVGSVTKNYIAATALKMAEEGLFSLDDTIYKYLPVMKNVSYGITIRMLLGHTSGLHDFTGYDPYYTFNTTFPDTIQTTEFYVNKFLAAPEYLPRSDNGDYSNTNFILAGMLLCKVTGLSLSEVLHKYIFDKYGLTDTHIFPDDRSNYVSCDGNNKLATKSFLNSGNAAGGIYTTPTDMVKWMNILFKGGFISDTSLSQMLDTHNIHFDVCMGCGPLFSYGLGIFKSPWLWGDETYLSYFHHGRWVNTAVLKYVPEDSIILAVCYKYEYNQLNLVKNLYDVTTYVPFISTASVFFYPNPSGGKFEFYSPAASNRNNQVMIFDCNGRKIYSKILPDLYCGEKVSMEIEDHPMGLCLVELLINGKLYTGKLLFE